MAVLEVVHFSNYQPPVRKYVERAFALVFILMVSLLVTSCGTAQANSNSPQSLAIAGSLPGGAVHQSYNAVLSVAGGNSPYQFSISSGSLPPGVTLNPATGSFTGQPTSPGLYQFEVMVKDSPRPDSGKQTFAVQIGPGGGGSGVSVSVSSRPAPLFLRAARSNSPPLLPELRILLSAGRPRPAPSIRADFTLRLPSNRKRKPLSLPPAWLIPPSPPRPRSPSPQIRVARVRKSPPRHFLRVSKAKPTTQLLPPRAERTPYTWSLTGGSLPAGITLNTNGDLSGTPTAVGTSNFTVKVTDAANKSATGSFGVVVVSSSGYDGPAQLPLATVPSSMADSPAPGSVINVKAGGDFQAALNSAQCGQTIQLQAGASFDGTFSLPAKGCNDQNWIIIRTSSPDSALPAEGQRLTPCYAGVASLPGRPAYNCPNPTNVLAKIENNNLGPDHPRRWRQLLSLCRTRNHSSRRIEKQRDPGLARRNLRPHHRRPLLAARPGAR